jgi:hypothetical protein
MSYIGSTFSQQLTTPAVDYFNGNGVTTSFQLTRSVTSVFAIQVVVNNVPQNAREAYGITSGNQLVFTSAPSAGTNNIYVVYDSQVGQFVTPSPGTVQPSSISAGGPTWDASGNLTINGSLTLSNPGTGAFPLPSGTTAQRPASPTNGMQRFNTETAVIEFYNGTSWVGIGLLDGSSPNTAAPSGSYLYNTIGLRTNGFYWIRPAGYNGSAFQVFVDFDGTVSGISGGGGWMRIAYAQDYYSQASPWTNTGIGDAPGASSVVFGLEFTDAQVSALLSATSESRQAFTSYGNGSVGWTYTNANVKLGGYMTVKQWQDGTGRDSASVAGSDYWGVSLSYLVNGDSVAGTLNSFPNSGSDPTDANDAAWRVGTIYIRDTSKTKLPIRRISHADVDGVGESRYFPLLSAKSHTWCK